MDAREVAKILKEFKDVPGTLRKRYVCPTCYGSDTCKLDQFPRRRHLPRAKRRVGLHPAGRMAGELALLGLLTAVAFLTRSRSPLIHWPVFGAALFSGIVFAWFYSKRSLHLRIEDWQQKRDFYDQAWICKRDITVWDPRLNLDGPNSGSIQIYTSNVSLFNSANRGVGSSPEVGIETFDATKQAQPSQRI